ncbi:MAG: class I SAM-dependent methyltransferase [Nitrospirota bacterium]
MIKRLFRKYFGRPIDIKRSWIDTPGEFADLTKFLSWFDTTRSIEETQRRAASDWTRKITAFPQYRDMPKQRCLEIGFGGGRLLVEASKDFTEAIGVDIHQAFNQTRRYLQLCNRTNITLLHRNDLPTVPDNSIDFVFSFIVFQHFDDFSEVDFYLQQIRRLLCPDGYAQIFYAKNAEAGIKTVDPREFTKRKCSLFVEPALFREAISRQFRIVEFYDVMKKHLDRPPSTDNLSEQASVLFTQRPISTAAA